MTERTGGSITLKDGQLIDRIEPTKDHPDGNRSRDAQGRPRDAVALAPAVVDPAVVEAPAPKKRQRFEPAE